MSARREWLHAPLLLLFPGATGSGLPGKGTHIYRQTEARKEAQDRQPRWGTAAQSGELGSHRFSQLWSLFAQRSTATSWKLLNIAPVFLSWLNAEFQTRRSALHLQAELKRPPTKCYYFKSSVTLNFFFKYKGSS